MSLLVIGMAFAMLALARRWSDEVAAQSMRPPPPCAPSHVRKIAR